MVVVVGVGNGGAGAYDWIAEQVGSAVLGVDVNDV